MISGQLPLRKITPQLGLGFGLGLGLNLSLACKFPRERFYYILFSSLVSFAVFLFVTFVFWGEIKNICSDTKSFHPAISGNETTFFGLGKAYLRKADA